MNDLPCELSPPASSGLRDLAERVRSVAERELAFPINWQYPDHSIRHCDRIINEYLPALLRHYVPSLEPAQALNCTERFVIIAAAYLHDIGMNYPWPGHNWRLPQWPTSADLRALRRDHGKRAAAAIRDDGPPQIGKMCGLRDPLRAAVALVVEGHPDAVSLADARFGGHEFDGATERVRIRELSWLLRIADGLDLCHRRVAESRLELGLLKPEARAHWLKSYHVEQVDVRETGMVHIHTRFPNHGSLPDNSVLKGAMRQRTIDVVEKVVEAELVKVQEDADRLSDHKGWKVLRIKTPFTCNAADGNTRGLIEADDLRQMESLLANYRRTRGLGPGFAQDMVMQP